MARARSLARGAQACLLAVAAVLLAVVARPAPAQAGLTFCNESSYLLTSAVAYEQDGGWFVEGWFEMDPGECKEAVGGDLGDQAYYAFARTRPAHGASRRLTAGDLMLCVDSGDFSFLSSDGCTGRGLQKVEFAEIDTHGEEDWTATFAEGGTFDDKRARVAGAQRLLRELGYEPGSVDGYTGGRTTGAIRDFQKANGLKVDGEIDGALFAGLEAAAERRLRENGFHMCNDTDRLVWAAIGYRQADEWRSSGWIRVPARSCAAAISSALDEPVFYAYAEAVTEDGEVASRGNVPMIWGGDRTFCTKPTRFFIRGRTNCGARGYDEVPFQEVNVGEEKTYTLRLR